MAKNQYKRPRSRPAAVVFRRLKWSLKMSAAAGGLVALSATIVMAYSVLTRHPYFEASQVVVKGAAQLTRSEIVDWAGIKDNVNVLSVNLNLTRRRLLSHPWIAEARVERELPDRLSLTVREQVPSAIFEARRRFLINTDGAVFKEWTSRDPAHLPVVSGLTLADVPRPDGPANKPFRAMMDVLRLARLPSSFLSSRAIERIQVDRDLGCVLYLKGPVQSIRLGYGGYAAKFRRFGNLLYHMKNSGIGPGIDWIDLQHPDRIVMRITRTMPVGGQGEE